MTVLTATLVDPHPIWLQATERALQAHAVEVVGASTSVEEASENIAEKRPHLLVIEPAGLGDDAFAWMRRQGERWPEMSTIVFSCQSDEDSIECAFANGARAYVVKKAHPVEIGVALRQLQERSIYFLSDRRNGHQLAAARDTELAGLTRREQEILCLAAEGSSNKAIARALWVTEQTVKFHLSNIYRKLRVNNRTQASRWAYDHGLVAEENLTA